MKAIASLVAFYRRHATPAVHMSLVTCGGTALAAALAALVRPRFLIPEFPAGMAVVSVIYFLITLEALLQEWKHAAPVRQPLTNTATYASSIVPEKSHPERVDEVNSRV